MEYFIEGLQAYFAPVSLIIFTSVFIVNDKLFEKRIKKFFLIAVGISLLIIIVTWGDRVLSGCDFEAAWYCRRITSCINFMFSPFAPAALIAIYKDESERTHNNWFYLPLALNAVACIASVFTGCIFLITEENTYGRGFLFWLPFAVAMFYMGSLIFFASNQKKPSKRIETIFLTCSMVSIVIATAAELILGARYMIWSTTACVIALYYTMLAIQKILYDPLTGAFTRTCYSKALELIDGKERCVISLIDINNLKTANDLYGHDCGDELISTVAQTLINRTTHRSKLYRVGGDEFVLITFGNHEGIIEYTLEKILKEDFGGEYNERLGHISYAYGTAEYNTHHDLQETIKLADSRMYEKKNQMKQQAKK